MCWLRQWGRFVDMRWRGSGKVRNSRFGEGGRGGETRFQSWKYNGKKSLAKRRVRRREDSGATPVCLSRKGQGAWPRSRRHARVGQGGSSVGGKWASGRRWRSLFFVDLSLGLLNGELLAAALCVASITQETKAKQPFHDILRVEAIAKNDLNHSLSVALSGRRDPPPSVMSVVQRVRLSRRSCMMRVESLYDSSESCEVGREKQGKGGRRTWGFCGEAWALFVVGSSRPIKSSRSPGRARRWRRRKPAWRGSRPCRGS